MNEAVSKTTSAVFPARGLSFDSLPAARYGGALFVICLLLIFITGMLRFRSQPLFPVTGEQLSWRQPAQADVVYPKSISALRWSFQFQPIEALLSKEPRRLAGGRSVDAQLLEKLVNQLPRGLADEQLQRIVFLLKRAGHGVVAKLIVAFYRYNATYNAFKAANKVTDYDLLMVKKAALQQQILGEDWAIKYYQHEQVLAQYLIAKNALLNNQATATGQRYESLEALQYYFKEHKGL